MRIAVAIALLLTVAGCSSGGTTTQADTLPPSSVETPPPPPVETTGGTTVPHYPTEEELADARACDPAAVRALVTEFVAAYNSGDIARLDSMFAQPPIFQWFSASRAGERFDPEAQNRDTLASYFTERHAVGERMRLKTFRFNGGDDFGNFEVRLGRSAPDYQNGRWFRTAAKGAVYCTDTDETFAVWSM